MLRFCFLQLNCPHFLPYIKTSLADFLNAWIYSSKYPLIKINFVFHKKIYEHKSKKLKKNTKNKRANNTNKIKFFG